MKTNTLFAALIVTASLAIGGSAKAEDIAKPAPAPAVADNPPDASSTDEPSVIDHVVYLAKLPTPDELVKGADAKGTPILRMDQTSDRIVVVYQYSGGRTVTFAYTLLSSSNAPAPVASGKNTDYRVATPTPAPPVTRTTTVVYQDPDVVYYQPRVRYYDPAWDFWTPLAIGVGLGWGFGGHGHYHGGYGGGWHGHGGYHH